MSTYYNPTAERKSPTKHQTLPIGSSNNDTFNHQPVNNSKYTEENQLRSIELQEKFEDFRAYQDYQGGSLKTFVQNQSVRGINSDNKSVVHSTIKNTNQEPIETQQPLVINRKQTQKLSFKLNVSSPREHYDSPIKDTQELKGRSASEIQSPQPYIEFRKSRTLAPPREDEKSLQDAEIRSLIEQSNHHSRSSSVNNTGGAMNDSVINGTIKSPDRFSSITENRRQTTVFGENVSSLDMLIAILRKNQRHRTERDLNRLLPLVKTIKFFKEFVVEQSQGPQQSNTESDKNLKEIVSCLTYEFVPKGCNVFEYGSQGDKFYILLQGEVGVLIPNSNDYNYREVREQIEYTRVQLAERQSDLVHIEEYLVEERLLHKFKFFKRQETNADQSGLISRLKLQMEKHFLKMVIKEKTGVELIDQHEVKKEQEEEKPPMDSLFDALNKKLSRSQKQLLQVKGNGEKQNVAQSKKELLLKKLNDHYKQKIIAEGMQGSKDQTFISEVCVKVSLLPDYSIQELKELIVDEISYLEDQLQNQLFFQVTKLEQGMSFGELALNNNQPRAATIACREDCHFAVMVKADYQKCLQTITKKHLQTILDFLRELPFIKHGMSSRSQLIKLQFNLHKKEYKRGQFVTKESDPLEHVFIIIKGEFEVTKKVTIKCEDKREEALCQEAVSAGQTSNLEAMLRLKNSEQQQLKFF
ncbi:hypothetical protein FGO68_gene15687 [Halteria grandinella]|uniref:Cyclic nucleotide-binding domain-containing protein n=1 Tax=Halteria grandinella TaxID=5974 RepID=A0A8J8P8N8_HALGN|nr:hypothetical protein FGO68_gene15687 [Halteria grandinella]